MFNMLRGLKLLTVTHFGTLSAGNRAALPTMLPRPQCWHAHNAAQATKTRANSPANPRCPGHSAALPTSGRRQCCTSHGAAQATVLACTQCCQVREHTSKLCCDSAVPGPLCCTAQSDARATLLDSPQCCPGHMAALPTVLPRPRKIEQPLLRGHI